MNDLPLYQIDAFSDRVFGGNPAAVVPLDAWPDDALMQRIAFENNLSETAFFVPAPEQDGTAFHIRWFTPRAEVPLCGHATLASAWVIFNRLGWPEPSVRLASKSGALAVNRQSDGWLELDFPALGTESVPAPKLLRESLAGVPETVLHVPADTNYLVVLQDEAAVRAAEPDMRGLKALGNQGVIITAPGDNSDFVSRYFAPGVGIDEDPVTGSIHSVLTPYWAQILGRRELLAHQVSERGGVLKCQLRGDRVGIAGQAAFYMEGRIGF
jgi:PhzF family phenazine biosynthesis protein